MTLKEEISRLAQLYETTKDKITSEKQTIASLIQPFFTKLGYDFTDPNQVIHEFVADTGVKKGEKVDLAILKDDKPLILIECKKHDEKLDNHEDQLFRYFYVASGKIAILTNGVDYRFYSDLDKDNIMDKKPFFEFNILKFDDNDISRLNIFSKEEFNTEKIIQQAKELQDLKILKTTIFALFENPSDKLIKVIADKAQLPHSKKGELDLIKKKVKFLIDEMIKPDNATISNSVEENKITKKDNFEIVNNKLMEYFISDDFRPTFCRVEGYIFRDNKFKATNFRNLYKDVLNKIYDIKNNLSEFEETKIFFDKPEKERTVPGFLFDKDGRAVFNFESNLSADNICKNLKTICLALGLEKDLKIIIAPRIKQD